MATSAEIKYELRQRLFELLEVKAELGGMEVKKLENLIGRTMATMDAEDIKHVEEKFAQTYKN